jgi:hypothetical protein
MAELDDFGIDHIKPGGVKLVNGDALHWGQGVPYSWRSREPWMNEGMCVTVMGEQPPHADVAQGHDCTPRTCVRSWALLVSVLSTSRTAAAL